jgi:RNA polymerase sigma factor (sigma-70 family)
MKAELDNISKSFNHNQWKKLDRALWQIARQFNTPENTPEDVYQHIVEKVLLRAKQDPQFSKKSIAYIANFAKWHAHHIIEKAVVYLAYVEDGDQPVSDNTSVTIIETITDTGAEDPEQAATNNEVWSELLKVIASLPKTHQHVVYGLYIGKKQREIAKEIGTTPQKITHIIKSLRTVLEPIAIQLVCA